MPDINRFPILGKQLFITATGTDIGKTALSLALLLWARDRGLRAAYCKPVQCGTYPFGSPLSEAGAGPGEGGDADWIRRMAGGVQPVHVTYQLRMAASPHLAAEKEGLSLDLGRMRRETESLAGGNDLLILEGAGGPAVPLDRRGTTLASLAADLSMPCLIACAPGLGTLHHTLATLAYLRSLSVPVAGFAFCHREAVVPETCADNSLTLEALTGLAFFGNLGFSGKIARSEPLDAAEAAAWTASLAASLDLWWNR